MAPTARLNTTLAAEHDACVEALFAHYRAIGLGGRWFRLKWRPGRGLQRRFARVVAAVKAHAGFACESTAAWKVENDAGSGESLMSCQHCAAASDFGGVVCGIVTGAAVPACANSA